MLRRLHVIGNNLVLALLVSGFGWLPSAAADSYNVNAVVPYAAPTQPAVFSAGLDDSTVQNALTTLTGTCQQENPATTVSILRSGIVLGSAHCGGTFTIQVMLDSGSNQLIARTANASMLYGPDSQPITINLQLPPDPPAAVPVTNPQAETPAEVTINTNAAADSDLQAWPSEPFSTLTTDNVVTIHVNVGGGQTPYTISLNWGDGSLDSRTVALAGVYEFSHSYQAPGNYAVRGSVHDVLGATTMFEYAVVNPAKATSSQPVTSGGTPTTKANNHWRPLVIPVTVAVGLVTLAAGGYWLGLHHAARAVVMRHHRIAKPRKTRQPHRRKLP